MKPETNLFLRALIGEKKSRLLEEDARIPIRCSPEDADRIIQINQELKALNSALSELKADARQYATVKEPELVDRTPLPTIPRLSGETAQVIREALDIHVKSAECCYPVIESMVDTPFFFGPKGNSKILQRAKDELANARRAKEEFNALYPAEKERGGSK